MSLRRFSIAILLGVLLTPPVWLAGALMTGGGHNPIPMIVLFPYDMYLIYGIKIGEVPVFVGMLLFCVQFVVYALILATVNNARQLFYLSVFLLLTHTLAVVFTLSAYRASEMSGHLHSSVCGILCRSFEQCGSMKTAAEQIIGRERETATFISTLLVEPQLVWLRFRAASTPSLAANASRWKI